MSVVVRLAGPHDFDAVGELTVAAYARSGQLGDDYARQLRDVAARVDLGEVLVAQDEDSGQVLGTVTFVLPGSELAELSRPGEAEFRMLAVTSGAQGRGVGEALVRACVERARTVGASALVLYTRDGPSAARRLYERLGFVRTPELDWTPDPRIVLLALRLLL